MEKEIIEQALKFWKKIGEVVEFIPYGSGHINDTFLVTTREKQYILQRINTNTFRDVDGLMSNIDEVTSFLREKTLEEGKDADREAMSVVRCDDEARYTRDDQGNCWRMLSYIEHSVCLQKARNEQDLFECAAAFGKFQYLLTSFPAEKLSETIPQFHDTENRYRNFEQAVAEDKMGRVALVQQEIEFLRQRKEDCSYMVNLQKSGQLPLRVTHNDTKLNNVLLDETTMKGLCVIDLDTVMPGLAANDFGDTVRFGANDCKEDEEDQSKVHFLLDLYKVCVKGFLQEAGPILTEKEIMTLPWGAKLMTLECGMRFLTDYLDGDHYFKISRTHQNLDRARTQFTLVRQMEACWDEMVGASKEYLDAKNQ